MGGRPVFPQISGISGNSSVISSDGFFELENLPKKTCVIGAGYIAVELSMILQTLGSETHLMIRYDRVLRTFDSTISTACSEAIEASGIKLHRKTQSLEFLKAADGSTTIRTDTAGDLTGFDCVLVAIGRRSNADVLKVENIVSCVFYFLQKPIYL